MQPINLSSFGREGNLVCPVLCISLFLNYAYCHRGTVSGHDELMPPLGLPNVVVHFDMKGAPPKLSYLASILPALKKYGANGLLIEYEDMFPFERDLAILRASIAYETSAFCDAFVCPQAIFLPQLEHFLIKAIKQGFQIIPLIQTFGHMQYVLKHCQFKMLREKTHTYGSIFPSQKNGSICPSQNKSKQLLHNMIEQIINFHARISPLTFIHIGCDEVNQINLCETCKDRHLPKLLIFQDHVKLVHRYIKELSPKTEVLMWDDMLRGSNGVKLPVDLIYWQYNWKMDRALKEILTHKDNSNNIWVASSFKGADGIASFVPDLEKRIENHFNWIQFLNTYARAKNLTKPDFRGIILTGWSRYDHFSPVCDLLPASFPSLITNLILIKRYNTQQYRRKDLLTIRSFYNSKIVEEVRQALECSMPYEGCYGPSNLNCSFVGNDLFKILKRVEQVKMNRRRNLPQRSKMEQDVSEAMVQYFDNNVVEKFLKYELTPPGLWPESQKADNQPDVECDSWKPMFQTIQVLFMLLFQLALYLI